MLVPIALGWRARFDVDSSHIFPQGVLSAITLVGGGPGDGWAGTGAECEPGLPPCLLTISTLLGVVSDLKLLGQNSEGHVLSWFYSF